jgi:uncharacterized protein
VGAPLREQLQAGLPAAMKAGDRLRVSVLRTTLAAVAGAEAVEAPVVRSSDPRVEGTFAGDVPRRELPDADVRAIVVAARDELVAAAAELGGLGQEARAGELSAQADVLDAYLGG